MARVGAPTGPTLPAERWAQAPRLEGPASEVGGSARRPLEGRPTCARRATRRRRSGSLDRLTLVRLLFAANHKERGDGPSAFSSDVRRAHRVDARERQRGGRSTPRCRRCGLRARAPRPARPGGNAHVRRSAHRFSRPRRRRRRPPRSSQAGRRPRMQDPISDLRSSVASLRSDACAQCVAAAPDRIVAR